MSRVAIKTLSWAGVSFFVILAIDLLAHLGLYGSEGFGRFFLAAALGTAAACVGKSPVYWWHERAWERRFAHRDASMNATPPAIDSLEDPYLDYAAPYGPETLYS